MAKMTLREYANQWLKNKGTTAAKAKKNAGKYKSIAAAKKAGSLYYTNKDGKVMLAVYAEDLKRGASYLSVQNYVQLQKQINQKVHLLNV